MADPRRAAAHVNIDLLVVGSGAAGMAAAIRAHDLGLKVLLIEKSAFVGGSTAMSGGVVWVADNPHMRAAGVSDSEADGLTYLRHITRGEVPDDLLQTYVRESKRMVDYLERHTRVHFMAVAKYTDYYPEAPGGRPGARSMECPPYDGAKLGAAIKRLRRPHPQSQIMGKFGITAAQAHGALVNNWRTKLFMLWSFVRYALRWRKRARAGRDTLLTAGNSLAARLYHSLLDRGVEVWTDAALVALLRGGGSGAGAEEGGHGVDAAAPPRGDDAGVDYGAAGGRITGAVVARGDERVTVNAARGVVLAAGGFERNAAMRAEYQPQPSNPDWNVGNPLNTGDAIRLGQGLGAQTAWLHEAWWTPVCQAPGKDFSFVLVVEKSLPHGIMVNRLGKRFTNEAAPYIDVVHGIYADHAQTQATVPAFLIFDATFRHRFPVGPVAPGYAMPDAAAGRWFKNGFLSKAETLRGLAEQIGIDSMQLEATVARFNDDARAGDDTQFGRGRSASDRYYGDPRVQPNPCLGPVETAPFYAIRVWPGDLGTKGGLQTDAAARVLGADGEPIPGLYAAGNTAASVMGPTYPGAGGTIGPALAFGMLAAEAAACGPGT